MNPQRIRAVNYRTFADLDLELPTGCVGIVGLVLEPGAIDSNGAGKSRLVGAIDVGLFGPDGASLRGDLSRGADDMMLELTFEHAGDTYRVRRCFSARGAGKSTLDLERSIGLIEGLSPGWSPLTLGSAKETQARLEELLGFTRPTFRASSFLVQGDSGAFTLADPADRKRILHRALGLERYGLLRDAVRRDMRAAEQEVQRIDGRLQGVTREGLAEERWAAEQIIARLDEQEQAAVASLAGAEAELTRLAEQIDAARRVESERAAAIARRDAAAAELSAKVRVREQADEARVQLDTVTEELRTLPTEGQTTEYERQEADLAAVVTVYEQAIREHEQTVSLAELRATEKRTIEAQAAQTHDRMGEIDRKAAHLDSGELDTCPTCAQLLGAEARAAALGSLRAQAQTLADEAQALFEQAAAIEIPTVPPEPVLDPQVPLALATVRELLRTAREAALARARLTERAAQLNERVDAGTNESYRAELEACEAALRAADAAVAALAPALDLAPLEAQALTARGRVEVARSEQTAAQREKAIHEERLAQLTARAAQLEADLADREARQAELELLAILERVYGPDGIPALILENAAIPQIETEAARLLTLLGGPVSRVELRTDREKRDGGVRDDVLDIVCVTETGDCDYRDLSGGEKFRVDVALRLALAQLLASRRGTEVRLLVVDEPDGLDASGKQALIEILRDLEKRGLDRVYLISHDSDLRDAFGQVLEVVKDADGRSRVEGALAEAVAA